MAAIVVFITTYALILPAITLERTAACGIEEHQHNDSCYEDRLVCGQEESDGHHHDDSCYSITSELICKLQEHQHSAENGCYDADGNLVCQLQEHVHDDSCYKEVRTLTCGLEESKGHQHTDACYKKVLICGKEVHTHSEACYQDTGENSEQESESGNAANPAASENQGADSAAAENNTSELTDSDNAATAETVLPGQEVTAPELAPLDFTTILNKDTGVYYYNVKPEERIEDSSKITDWTRAKDKNDNADDFTELAPEDLIRVYLAYTVPTGSLNTTNPTARYRLPDSIRLSDKQIEAINKAENGISSQYDDKDKHDAALGAEAIEGTRRPDQDIDEYLRKNSEDGQEYINATVKAENVFNDKTGEYEGQDLIFTFTPYTIEKNQVVYDTSGEMTKSGENVRGWFTFDMTTDQVEWGEAVVSSIKTGEETEGESEEAEDIETENVEVDNTAEQADEGTGAEAEENPDKEKTTDEQETAEDTEQEKTSAEETTTSGNKGSSSVIERSERSADIVFVKEGYDVDNNRIEEIATTLKLVEEKEVENSLEDDSDSSNDDTASDFAAGTLEASGEGYKITMEYTAEAQVPENASLSVREITAETDPEAYKECLEQAGRKIASDDSDDAVDKRSTIDETASRFFDIEIVVSETDEDGQETSRKIEPKAEVSVNIQMTDTVKKASDNSVENTNENDKASGSENQGAQEPTVLHFTDDGVEKLQSTVVDDKNPTSGDQAEDREKKDSETAEDTDSAVSKNGSTEIQFTTDSFSIYGVVYTVDFEYNGYMVSIPGDSSILLSRLLEVLGLDENGDVPAIDLQNVESVEFSNDQLIRITKVEQEATVNDILTELDEQGVETWLADGAVVRTDDKSDEEVLEEAEAIEQADNDEIVNIGDWLLTALQAFHSEETLTITMLTGEKYVINVTDLDTSQNGQKPALVTDTVNTIAEGIKITMFDYGPEKLDNVNNTYNSTDNSGINKGHTLKFYSYGTTGNTVNNFTGGAYAMQGVVQSSLGPDGYPVVNNGNETLRYLFDPDYAVNGKTVVTTDANYLFRRIPERGMELFYDSDENYAYLDGNDFKIYSDTYLEEGADYENPFRIGFYPYNDYDNRYQCIHGNNFNWGCKGSKDWRVRDQVGHYNHHFGMKVEGNFYMTDDKMITNETNGNKEEMKFKFSGDDDMWVFIDGVLVLDIGGIHNPVDGEINFTTGQVTVSAVKTANGGSAYALGANTTIAQAFAKAGKTWDDSPLSHHDIKIFYMERGGMYSNLAVTMNLPTFPHTKEVTLTKQSADGSVNLAGATFALFSDVACTKPVKNKETGEAITVTSSDNPSTLGQVKISNLIPGQTYYFKETTSPGGYKLFDGIFMITVPANDHDPAVVYLTADGQPVEGPITEIKNTPDAYGSFDFFKVEEGTSTKISGAEFTLYTDADCQTIAKDRDHHDLVSTSASDSGKVSFANIPAGATYYMKETQEPQDYFPSSNVYRVVVSEDGNTVSVYKGSSTPPLFTNTTGDTDRIIENKPKADKTSVTVEKLWSDGAANHTNDTVTVQLYETTEDLKVSGGTINVQVVADKWIWEGDTNQEKINTAPTADGASLSYKIYKYGDANQTAVASGTLNNGNGWSSTHQLNDMAESEHIKYVVEVTDQDGNVITNASVYDPEDGSVQGSDSDTPGAVKKVHVQADVQDVQTPKMTISASNIRSKSMYNKWRITFQEVRLMYDQNGGNFSGYVNSSNPLWSENYFTFDGNNGSETKEITLPDLSSVSSSELNKYWYRIAFDAQEIADDENVHITVNPGYNLGYENRYTTTKGYYDFQGNRSDYLYIPASATNITISFTGTNSGTLNIDLSRPSLAVTGPQDAMYGSLNELISSGILGGEENTAYADGNKHGNPVVLSNGNWTHTWDNLISTETVTEGGYTIIRTHHYYVREVSVHFADDSIDEDTVLAEYSYIFNEDGDPSSGIKKVVINNTVPPKTSITVTKEWKNQDGTTYEPPEGQRTITFDVYQKVDGTASVYKTGQQIECTYDTASQSWKWGTVTISGLPTKVKVGDELKDAVYYVVETSPAASDDLTTYYIASDGKTYPDAEDAAGASSETIVNVNSRKEIKITKAWYYKNGTSLQEVAEPEVKEIFFKLKKVDKTTGEDIGFYTAGSTEMPESDVEGQSIVSSHSPSDGTIFRIACVSTSTEVPNEYGGGTHTETTWAWNTLTFKKLPTDVKYYMVETDANGNPLIHDTANGSLEISYVDANGKEITQTSPIDASIPGDYTIKNIEKRTSLYAEKIWNAANKDNLVGNEPIWFSLMRIQTDGNGTYDPSTLEETPEIGRFNLKESEGWTRCFSNIPIAPTGQTNESQYKYYQYFAVELGLLKSGSDVSDEQKQYELIDDLFIKYQSKGGGTGSAPDGSDARAYSAYSEGADAMGDLQTQPATVQQWIEANRGKVISWLTSNADKIQVRTWGANYDGSGTLGIFNSSNEYVEQPIHIIKEWKKANGDPLDQEKLEIINAEASDTMDKYTLEIRLMQRAKNLEKDGTTLPGSYDSQYGSTVLLAKDEVIMQSDLFHVIKEGSQPQDYWKYQIPPTYTNADGIDVNQLPAKGPFVLDGVTYQADFEYYISEYRVYNGNGDDRTPHWTAACLINKDSYTLTLENYETTDLTVHKTWEEVPTENRNFVDDNVKAVLYKVFRIPDGETDESKKEDITELIGANYEAYDLTAANIYETRRTVKIVGGEEIEVNPATEPEEGEVRKTYYEDYIRIDQPDGSWWRGSSAKDAALKISNLDTHIRDYVTEGSKDDWKKYKYWIVEQEYIDGAGKEHPISELLHGNTTAYPKYQTSTAGTGLNTPNFGNDKPSVCAKIEIGPENAAHLGAINTVKGSSIHLLKDDETDSTRKLSGAKFILRKKNGNNVFVLFDYAANMDGTALTINKDDSNGQFEITNAAKGVTITGLMPGIYELQEKKAPDGYIIMGAAMQFEVKTDGTLVKLPPTGQTVPEEQTDKDPRFKLEDSSAAGQKISEMTVHNHPGSSLPSTGGPGTWLFTILGNILILGAGVLLWRRRRLI